MSKDEFITFVENETEYDNLHHLGYLYSWFDISDRMFSIAVFDDEVRFFNDIGTATDYSFTTFVDKHNSRELYD